MCEEKFLNEITKIKLEDGDTVILRCNKNITIHQHATLQEMLYEFLAGLEIKVNAMILEEGIGVEVKKIEG